MLNCMLLMVIPDAAELASLYSADRPLPRQAHCLTVGRMCSVVCGFSGSHRTLPSTMVLFVVIGFGLVHAE